MEEAEKEARAKEAKEAEERAAAAGIETPKEKTIGHLRYALESTDITLSGLRVECGAMADQASLLARIVGQLDGVEVPLTEKTPDVRTEKMPERSTAARKHDEREMRRAAQGRSRGLGEKEAVSMDSAEANMDGAVAAMVL
jgi:hypothetical protein